MGFKGALPQVVTFFVMVLVIVVITIVFFVLITMIAIAGSISFIVLNIIVTADASAEAR